ncbi:MAG: hypothetical protein AAF662_01470 [Pseudomonadota bacterium]
MARYAELHDEVLLCDAPIGEAIRKPIHLSADSIGEIWELEAVVVKLLDQDFRARRDALENPSIPEDLSPGEGSRASLIVDEYERAGIYLKQAICLVTEYKKGDTVRRFSNVDILPNKQEGFVLLRGEVIVARLLTFAVYFD